MKLTKYALSFLGAAALGTTSLPAFADTATEQVGTQTATITGDNNQVIQVINQVTVNGGGRGRTHTTSTATVQDAAQGAVVQGSGNSVYQESNQVNVNGSSENRGRRNGQDPNHHNNNGNGNNANKKIDNR